MKRISKYISNAASALGRRKKHVKEKRSEIKSQSSRDNLELARKKRWKK